MQKLSLLEIRSAIAYMEALTYLPVSSGLHEAIHLDLIRLHGIIAEAERKRECSHLRLVVTPAPKTRKTRKAK